MADDEINIDITDIGDTDYSIDMSTITIPTPAFTGNVTISGTSSSNYTIGATGASGAYLYTTAGYNGTSWSNSAPSNTLDVKGDANFQGDVKIKGRSLEKLLSTIEDRLAILQDPNPAKLEKYAALKKAYDHYKTLERLIGED